ncbi:MAG: hypothetical protein LQ339_008555 [Xanthoria mediterranea]|nr:MAG: hypothetical protein LQ339_008555 [Xanthoria mediterranea]
MVSGQSGETEATVIPEQELIRIAKSLKQGGTNDPNGISSEKQLKATLRTVIKTASCTQLSESHAATACDTLRACLARCEDSGDPDLLTHAYSQETWTEIFDIFLRSSESRKPKPFKLLLLALERNLTKNPSQFVKDRLIAHIISKTWQVISLQDDGDSAVKPSLQALRHFICKNVIRAQDIVLISSQDLGAKVTEGANPLEIQNAPIPMVSLSASTNMEHSHRFLCKTLSWVRHPDVAPITGRLIGVFCSSLRAWSYSWETPAGLATNSHGNQPIWFSALKSSVQSQPELLDLFAVHVFPEIVRQDCDGIADFAEVLSLKHLEQGNLIAYGSADLHISFLLLRAMKQKGTFNTIDNETIDITASKLLCHADPHIRVLAFSIVIQSSSPKIAFPSTVLSSLVNALPNYHAEVDPKARQENLALIKRLCLRLKGVLISLSKGKVDLWSTKPTIERDRLLSNSSAASELAEASREHHLDFFVWYRDFLLQELSPTGSYQRHVVSLKVIDFLMSSSCFLLYEESSDTLEGERCDFFKSFYHELLTSLLALAIDPFDDVRELAACILKGIPRAAWASLSLKKAAEVRSLCPSYARESGAADDIPLSAYNPEGNPGLTLACQRTAKRAQTTARADHADGFGRLYALTVGLNTVSDQEHTRAERDQHALGRLMIELNDRIRKTRVDIHTAVKTASLHGLLIAARYLVLRYNRHNPTDELETSRSLIWRDNCDQLLSIASNVWLAVKHILCADAPEGYEPDTLDDQNPVGTKDMLSFCWRALKESSTSMHSMIAGSKGAPIVQAFQTHHYRIFGELAFTELAELRHRGAFSTVSQTFSDCCIRCVESKDLETQELPKSWYQKTLLCIQQRASALTRRSAGLPAMITGILSATPKGAFFDTVIRDLQAIAQLETDIDSKDEHLDLPQVHAFNCLKDIFTDARFNTAVEQHMSASLELAVHALESDRWAVRNCGLMFMKALITRMNDGTNTLSSKAPSSHRRVSSLVYEKYPNVPDLLLRLLTHEDVIDSERLHKGVAVPDTLLTQAQHVFPALEIIEQSGIPTKYYTEIWQASWNHLEGPVWALRDKAAKALSYLPNSNAIETEVRRSLQSSWSRQNSLHGRLLYLRYLIIRLRSDSQGLHAVLIQILKHFQIMIIGNPCPMTRSTYVTLLADILEAISKDEFAGGNCRTSEKYKWRPSTPLKMSCKCSSEDWRLLTQYLHRDCPGNPAFALEVAAKRRCTPLVASFDESAESSSQGPEIGHTIFADSRTSDGPCHPEHADQMLRLSGRFLASVTHSNDVSLAAVSTMTSSWSRALQLALDDHAEVSTRQAAVDSLAEFFDRTKDMKVDSEEASGNLLLMLVLYDSLFDDDEDVRDSGAATVSKLLSSITGQDGSKAVGIPLMVPAASRQLLCHLKDRYRTSPALWMEAVQRIIGTQQFLPRTPHKAHQSPRFLSPRTLLARLKPEDTALFVEEKQNLYIDEAKEAGTWLEVLLTMDRTAIDIETLRQLEGWTFEGIDALTDVAGTEIDGPLGWTSKPEVYTLGVRILHAAQALMRFSKDESLGVDGNALRARLEKMLVVGEESYLNGSWMRMIRKSLE